MEIVILAGGLGTLLLFLNLVEMVSPTRSLGSPHCAGNHCWAGRRSGFGAGWCDLATDLPPNRRSSGVHLYWCPYVAVL